MKTLYVLLSCIGCMTGLRAQVTITNSYFPVAGDTLRTITDLNPTGIIITPPGGPYAWDFTSLAFSTQDKIAIRPASEGVAHASYPTATLFSPGMGGQAETYFSSDASTFAILGFSGTFSTGGLPIDSDFKYAPPLTERRAPLNFFDIHSLSSNLNFAFSLSSIPGGILDSLGIPTGLADSVRIRISLNRLDVADAFGTLAIPGASYDVLREKRTLYQATSVDIHTILGWIDITGQLGGLGGFGTDTTITYIFHSNAAKEYIAEVTMDSSATAVQEVTFKDNGVLSSVGDVPEIAKNDILVSPNPVRKSESFILNNLLPGSYTLQVYNTSGIMVMNRQIQNQDESISAERLDLGLYFIQVLDKQNKVIGKGKVVIAGE